MWKRRYVTAATETKENTGNTCHELASPGLMGKLAV